MHAQIGTELSRLRSAQLLDDARRERRERGRAGITTRRPVPAKPSE
jgi:hypothetical protein